MGVHAGFGAQWLAGVGAVGFDASRPRPNKAYGPSQEIDRSEFPGRLPRTCFPVRFGPGHSGTPLFLTAIGYRIFRQSLFGGYHGVFVTLRFAEGSTAT